MAQSVSGNPWWSEPGWTLDQFEEDGPGEATGRHSGRNIAEAAAPRHAGQEPRHRAEPDGRSSTPVQEIARRPSLADIVEATGQTSYEEWLALRLSSLRQTGTAGAAHIEAALRCLATARRGGAGKHSGETLGPAVGKVAEGTASPGALHGTGRDETPRRAEDLCYCSDEIGFDPANPHPFPHFNTSSRS